MKMWIARDKNGELYLHTITPFKMKDWLGMDYWCNKKACCLRLSDKNFPEVTFENSPQEVELKLIEK